MAGAKLSPRQKMINLMYLVLLALLAMQVSVEVMEAFAKMYERSEDAIEQGVEKNKATLGDLKQLSNENSAQYAEVYQTAINVEAISKEFIAEIRVLKNKIKEANPIDPETEKLPATKMDKGDLMDEFLFAGDKNSKAGDKFVTAVDTYRGEMLKLISAYPNIVNQINASFNTEPVKIDGITKKDWLEYNFKGIPTIGTIAILSSMESAVLNIENEALTNFVSGRLKKASSATQLQAFVKLNKNTYSPGDEVRAEVFLASKDDTKVPTKVEINGKNIDLKSNFDDGKVIYKFKAGAVGDQPIIGKFIFTENGKEIPVAITGNYSVVAGSNQAIISADKMNVVYRGIENPITISLPGISPTKIKANAPGLRPKGGSSYVLNPGAGTSVQINVTGTTDAGETIKSAPVTFRIKDIPAPMASIRGEYGSISMPKTSLAKSSIAAGLPDFVFDLDLNVLSFKVKVPGKTTVIVNGDRMNAQAQKAIESASRGDIVTIFGIRAAIVGNSSYKLKEVLPISVEISN
ncbi:gliding motility protein GldM [Wenyingzhuangia sp. chi5]|uniref:Gliding motility protein GldM n=1 Tax=Wenyingzhuangia gilva TaxID=3057677 RepID=A0ABT8VQH3_9FLAO|nr:gliding motility protein GldM [Wenyingzhuangia sp. chi5]MDO3694210.1 gliding motility protein GldM [Wenyingzhuangia sp. chi5]